jgi:hypothetical protein
MMSPSKENDMALSITQSRRPALATVIAAFAGAALVACASTQLDAEWRDPQLNPGYLHGERVLVSCQAYEAVIVQLCRDQVAGGITAQGVLPVFVPTNFPIAPDRPIDPQLLLAARDAGAKAVLVTTVAVASSNVSQGFSIGIGGFGFGSSGGGGVGISAPVGGGNVTSGYAANGRLIDVASERLLWTGKATSPASSDVNAQMGELSKTLLAAATRAGAF